MKTAKVLTKYSNYKIANYLYEVQHCKRENFRFKTSNVTTKPSPLKLSLQVFWNADITIAKHALVF